MFCDEMSKHARILAVACAVALSLPPYYFADMFGSDKENIFRLSHYPPVDEKTALLAKDGDRIRCGEHTDYDLITILFTDRPGLQAKPAVGDLCTDVSNEGWVDVPQTDERTAIVNLGGLMTRVTNDEWKAVAHRVILPRGPEALEHKYTLASFWTPDSDVVLKVHPRIAGDKKVRYKPTTTEGYYKQRLRLNGEEEYEVG